MKWTSILIVSSALWAACSTSPRQEGVLTVDGGQIQGVEADASDVIVYKGIPYAAPPVGNLRWKAPQPVEPWEGVRTCDAWGAASLQGGQQEGSFYWKEFYQAEAPEMSEDCLYLNVWKPAKAKRGDKLPVMVWIHGGAYQNGYGYEVEFDGTAFARREVILVTVNYRLGMCGFLAHPLRSAGSQGQGSGNYGLLDQVEALRWVNRNIEAFGGDATNVTLFGQSAGAGSVQTLLSSGLTQGLVHRAIIQSGGGLSGIISAKSLADAEAMGKGMWEEAGCTTLEQMRATSPDDFQKILYGYLMKQKAPFMGLPWGPCIDGYLLPDTLNNVARRGETLRIPTMIGYCSQDIAPEVMRQAAVDWSLLQEEQGLAPSYVYCFNRDLPGADLPDATGGFMPTTGAFHSSELWYVFGTLGRCWRPMTPGDYALSRRMVAYWTNFARTGNPNGQLLSDSNPNGQLLSDSKSNGQHLSDNLSQGEHPSESLPHGEALPEWKPCSKANPHVQLLDVEQEGKENLYEGNNLSVAQLNPETWQIENGEISTMYLLKGTRRALLIDTGMTSDSLDVVVHRLTDLPLDVVISHNHVDHVGGNRFFPEVWVHPADKGVRDVPYEGKELDLQEGQLFDLGDRLIRVMLMPGHTPGSVIFVDEKYRSAFTSDAFGSGHVWLQLKPHVPMTTYIASCERMVEVMRSKGITKLYPGHFGPYADPLDRTYMNDMLELAGKLSQGNQEGSQEYPYSQHIDIAARHTRCLIKGRATLVYDADNVN